MKTFKEQIEDNEKVRNSSKSGTPDGEAFMKMFNSIISLTKSYQKMKRLYALKEIEIDNIVIKIKD
jgi:hypothetical protein